MNEVKTRGSFFPTSRNNTQRKLSALERANLKQNAPDKAKEIYENTKDDARVAINDKIKDFSFINGFQTFSCLIFIKKAVDRLPEKDNSEKIALLKNKVEKGDYKVDYESVADKILRTEY